MYSQRAPIHRSARLRQSSDGAWPLRRANGLTWADAKAQKDLTDDTSPPSSAN